MEDRKIRKRTWEAARWTWGWERMLTFEGACFASRYVEEALDLSLDRIL
jgi:hypothetical protein